MPGPRAYTNATRTALSSLANGCCYFPGCSTPIVVFVEGEPFLNVDIAHIRDAKPGNRYDPAMTDEERAHFRNLILLCRPHHGLVDTLRPEEFSANLLENWKRDRENSAPLADPSQVEALTASWSRIGRPPATVLSLPLDSAVVQPPSGRQLTPYQVLWPRFGVVPFRDHSGVLSDLHAWCSSGDPLSAAFVDGSGGAGKTRTAVELCRLLERSGWLAGFYRYGTMAPGVALAAQSVDKLVVFDYANDRPNQITEILDQLVSEGRHAQHKTRFLLVTRNGQQDRASTNPTVHQSEATSSWIAPRIIR